MRNRKLAVAGYLTLAALAARAANIDTFTFTETGFTEVKFLPMGQIQAGAARPDVRLTGSFTGTLEQSGFMDLADLSAFTVTTSTADFVVTETLNLVGFFSFNVNGGSSSFGLAGILSGVIPCLGPAVTAAPVCNGNLAIFYPPGTFAAIIVDADPEFISSSQPVITLVSSVNTATAQAPEPASFLLTGAVLVAAGLVRWRRRSALRRIN
jgi:hypothetical protein